VLQDTAAVGGGADGIDFTDMFEAVEMPSDVANFAQALKDAFFNQDFDWFYELGEMIGGKFTDALKQIPWDDIQEWANATVGMVAKFLNGAVSGADWSVIGQTVGQAINTVFGAMHTWYTTFDFHNFGKAVAEGINHALYTTDFDLIGSTIAEKLSATIRFLAGIAEDLDWGEVGNSVATAINALFRDFDFARLTSGINAFALGLINAIGTLVSGVEWSDIGYKIANALNDIKWNDIISGAFGAAGNILNAIVDTISTLASTFNFSEIGRAIADGVNNLLNTFDFAKLASGLSNLAKGLLDMVIRFVSGVDWKLLGENIKTFIVNIDWLGIINSVARLIGNIISGAFDVLRGLLGDELGALTAVLATSIIGLKIAGLPLAAVFAAATVSFLAFEEVAMRISGIFEDALRDQLGYEFPKSADIAKMSLEEIIQSLDDTYDAKGALDATFRFGTDAWANAIAPAVAKIGELREALKMHEVSLEIVRFADSISDATKVMLNPMIDNADNARKALLDIFYDGKPVVESDTLEITGYIKEMASTAIDQLRRMKDAALENLAFIYGEEAMEFERRLSEATRFYDDRLREIEREMLAKTDAVRHAQLMADEEVKILGEVSAETKALLDDALDAERRYREGIESEKSLIENARQHEVDRVKELFPQLADEYFVLRDDITKSFADQEQATKSSTDAMRNIISENMQAGKELTLENFDAMTNGIESYLDSQIELLVNDSKEKSSIAQTRNDDLYRIDRSHINNMQAMQEEALSREVEALKKSHAEQRAELQSSLEAQESLTSHQREVQLHSFDRSAAAELAALQSSNDDQFNTMENHFDRVYDLTEVHGVLVGTSLVDGYTQSINRGTEEMMSSWSTALLDSIKAGDVAIGRRSPAKATIEQGEDMGLGVAVGIKNTTSNAIAAMQTMLMSMTNVVISASDGFHDTFKNMYNRVLATTEAFANNLINGINRGVSQAVTALRSLPDAPTITVNTGSSISIPRLRTGHPFIPFDDFPALLHRGERVLTAEENRDYSGGGNEEMVASLAQQNRLLAEQNELLRTIAAKDMSVNIGDKEVAAANYRGKAQLGSLISSPVFAHEY
jgi:hypothetical protein